MDSLYLKWKDYYNGNIYYLGALVRDSIKNIYYFKIDNNGIKKAKEAGFNPASLPFTQNKIYKSTQLFEFFKMRVPKIEKFRQKKLTELLDDLNLKEIDEFDEFKYLIKTKGKIAIDNFFLEET